MLPFQITTRQALLVSLLGSVLFLPHSYGMVFPGHPSSPSRLGVLMFNTHLEFFLMTQTHVCNYLLDFTEIPEIQHSRTNSIISYPISCSWNNYKPSCHHRKLSPELLPPSLISYRTTHSEAWRFPAEWRWRERKSLSGQSWGQGALGEAMFWRELCIGGEVPQCTMNTKGCEGMGLFRSQEGRESCGSKKTCPLSGGGDE